MGKRILKIAFIFAIGMAGGIFSSQVILPYFFKDTFLSFDSQYLAKLASGPIYLTEKKDITVQENTALQDSIEKVKKSIIGIKTTTKSGKTIYGSGLALTSDGLIVTFSDVIPRGGEFVFYVEGRAQEYQILKRDESKNLVLVKLGDNNLVPCGFADIDGLELGQRVFLLGAVFENGNMLNEANQGIVKIFTEDYIKTNILESSYFAGSGLFDIKGEVLGLNMIGENGKVTALPISFIRNFAGL